MTQELQYVGSLAEDIEARGTLGGRRTEKMGMGRVEKVDTLQKSSDHLSDEPALRLSGGNWQDYHGYSKVTISLPFRIHWL